VRSTPQHTYKRTTVGLFSSTSENSGLKKEKKWVKGREQGGGLELADPAGHSHPGSAVTVPKGTELCQSLEYALNAGVPRSE